MTTTLKKELKDLIGIHFKDYRWTIDETYDKHILCIVIKNSRKDYEIYININEPWERNKKELN